MHIIGLEVENFKRIRAVNIEPDGPGAIVISGKNGQGKSSVLDAIWAALGGRDGNKAAKPIRDGAESARVRLDLGDMIVTRTWRNGTSAVKVESKEGAEYKSPQAMLDRLIGRLAFDPLAFTRLRDREQKDALLALVDLDVDLEKLDADRARLYSERTDVGRLKAQLGEDPWIDPALPREEESATALLDDLQAATVRNNTIRDSRERAEALRGRVAELEQQLEALRTELGRAEANGAAEPADESALRERLQGIDERNARIRANNAAREKSARIARHAEHYVELSDQIDEIDKTKAEALKRAAFPVPGLGFDADGVTFNGIPFSQASSAEQIRVSLAMAMASHPQLRVIRILDGSLLDDEAMALISDAAAEHDYQVWIERVANGDGVGFIIEDGALAEEPGDVVA